ncbi:hypothetical protein BX600DRAFT_436924 [Xylariales sp. PMI_506]|nr:hypothetical protein BX600DRAFT_436924 [Xylariales sp. PMI_506]
MKWSIATQALCGATAVSALAMPRSLFDEPAAGALPLENFGTFETMTIDEAKAGLVKIHDMIEDVIEDIEHAFGINDGSSSDTTVAAEKVTCDNPNIRFEWRNYSDSDRLAFVESIKCLQDAPPSGDYPPSTSRFEDFARVHQNLTSIIHGNARFLLWHRYFTWALEQVMRDECGFDRAFPWWDETLDAGNFAGSTIFTPEYFGSLPTAADNQSVCITDGVFANTTAYIGPGTADVKHCLARAVDETDTAQCNEDFVNTCNSRSSYADMENCSELGPHAYGHNGIGAVMADVSGSPIDPVFYMHHLFIDRNFWAWQGTNTTRLSTIDGCIDSQSPCTPLTLDTVISLQGLKPDVTVADILNTQDGVMCYLYTY